MSMIKSIIKNELDKRLGRIALSEDINNAIDYISDWVASIKFPTLSDIIEALDSFIKDNYAQCEICGEYYNPDDMSWEYGRLVCGATTCVMQAENDHNFNPHREWGTY